MTAIGWLKQFYKQNKSYCGILREQSRWLANFEGRYVVCMCTVEKISVRKSPVNKIFLLLTLLRLTSTMERIN